MLHRPTSTTNAAASPADVRTSVQDLTTRIKTRSLSRHGIDEIRVLSESQFLRVLGRLAEESAEKQCAGTAAAEAADEAPMSETLKSSYQRRWERLRRSHRSNVERMERRLGELGESISEIEGALRRIERAAIGAETPRSR
jgi:hypothetical protein